ncbi:DUF3159 domain-containing protein [Nesterenkonia alba]|uniref:DUF3159 domain-containing protein n=1 Tax=Nesterenkonia alba TaxID=515814 RepID=UPI0003B5C028|nr:DUF3159 domain-containing protein [Nesterenkonia alba]
MSNGSNADQVGRQLSDSAAKKLSTRDDGSLDIKASVGGWRGVAEAALPAAAFLTAYLITEDLVPALIGAIVMGAVFTAIRLAQRGSLIQSFSGLIGVLICAAFAYFSGDARGYYEPGFFINAGYILLFVVSIAVKWPAMGVLFGLVRGEGFEWRHDPIRRRRYALATWIITAVLSTRLVVQLPLYWADHVAALGVARVVMGVPLYAFGLWLGWMITRPQAHHQAAEKAAQKGDAEHAAREEETAEATPPSPDGAQR